MSGRLPQTRLERNTLFPLSHVFAWFAKTPKTHNEARHERRCRSSALSNSRVYRFRLDYKAPGREEGRRFLRTRFPRAGCNYPTRYLNFFPRLYAFSLLRITFLSDPLSSPFFLPPRARRLYRISFVTISRFYQDESSLWILIFAVVIIKPRTSTNRVGKFLQDLRATSVKR